MVYRQRVARTVHLQQKRPSLGFGESGFVKLWTTYTVSPIHFSWQGFRLKWRICKFRLTRLGFKLECTGNACTLYIFYCKGFEIHIHVQLNESGFLPFQLRNAQDQRCFDNHQYLFQAPERLYFETCHFKLATQVGQPYNSIIYYEAFRTLCSTSIKHLNVFINLVLWFLFRYIQGFSLTKDHFLRTSLQCVVLKEDREGARPMLEDCIIGPKDKWTHIKVNLINTQNNLDSWFLSSVLKNKKK